MSVRSYIIANIETVLKAVTGLVADSVFVGDLEQVDLDAAGLVFPLTYVIQGPEQKASEQVHGMETWDWTVTIEVRCSDTSVETLYKAIQAAMLVDITRGGHARKTERTGGNVLPSDPGRGLSAFQLNYQIQYRHPWGTP